MASEKQQLLFESMEEAVIESLYSDVDPENEVCPDCDSALEVSYDRQNIARYFCDNCGCSIRGQTAMLTADRDIVMDTEA